MTHTATPRAVPYRYSCAHSKPTGVAQYRRPYTSRTQQPPCHGSCGRTIRYAPLFYGHAYEMRSETTPPPPPPVPRPLCPAFSLTRTHPLLFARPPPAISWALASRVAASRSRRPASRAASSRGRGNTRRTWVGGKGGGRREGGGHRRGEGGGQTKHPPAPQHPVTY